MLFRSPEADRLTVLTKASLVQAEASTAEDMAKVARVLENRLSDGMALQLDTTVNYANGKGGITTTPEDRANPSLDRKSTRLNSSHANISYAVFCLKKNHHNLCLRA